MASNLKPSLAAANLQSSTYVGAVTNSSTLSIYSGTQPTTPETAASGTLLATVTLPASAAMTSNNGVLTAAAIASVTIATSGVASWFRWAESGGSVVLADGSVGTSGSDMNLNSTALSSGATLSITSFTYTVPGY